MGLFVYERFLLDLRDHADAGFAKRVLRKVLNNDCTFREDREDHRYDAIEDAWIRYVSRQGTAWRAIYIRKGSDVYLYRCGEHSIEDGLSAPGADAVSVQVEATCVQEAASASKTAASQPRQFWFDPFLQNSRGRLLRSFLLGRRLFPHREVILISPFVSLPMLARGQRVGDMFDQLMEEGAAVTLITVTPPLGANLAPYEELSARGFRLHFNDTLHAKLYIFDVRRTEKQADDPDYRDIVVLGSANLTEQGFGIREPNEELCYELPADCYDGAIEFAAQVMNNSIDLPQVRLNRQRNGRRV